jgi:hypothetical protein
MGKLDQFLEWFHDGREYEYDKILKVFQTTRRFLQAVIKYGEKDQIDVNYIPYSEFRNDTELFDFIIENNFLDDSNYNDLEDILKNYYLEYWIGNAPDVALKFICDDLLTDVEIRSDGFWLHLRDRDELAVFFDDRGRDGTARDVAKHVFSEDMWDPYWDTTSDVYRDVIEELDDNNKKHLGEYILRHIGNQDLNVEDYSADFLQELADIQAKDGVFQITQDNVGPLIGDEEAMNELLNGDLDELKSELYSLHNSAYNRAYEEECYDLVYKGLEEFFSSRIMDEAKQVGEKTKYYPYIKIRNFQSDVMAFIYENKGGGYNDSTLEYWGSYAGMMGGLFDIGIYDEIDFRIPDYADWDYVRKNINDMLGDYI